MSSWKKLSEKLRNTQGATAVLVALCLTFLLGVAALAIDVGYLYGVRNELTNGADAGALAGALILFKEDGSVNTGANAEAARIAGSNDAAGGDITEITVQRGHWSFTNKTFTPNNNTTQVELDGRDFWELDLEPNFINSVRVVTSKSDTPSFFAQLLGYADFFINAEAIAYLGFAGSLDPSDVDQPIAICKESIEEDGDYSCNIGRMINSGSNELNNETGGWTNFDQDQGTCNSGTNADEMFGLICGDGNPDPIQLGLGVGANGGQIQSAFDDFFACWENVTDIDGDGDGIPDKPWNMTLLVVECPSNNMENCSKVVGAVNLNVVWINRNTDPQRKEVPRLMTGVPDYADWNCDETIEDGQVCWDDFADHFNIQNVDGSPAPYQAKAIYFLPDCTPHIPKGETGGDNFGILAKYPKLVK